MINLSYAHGVFPLVYHTLKLHADLIPTEVISEMKSNNMDIVKKNMLMTAELIKVMKILEENGIEAIAFKGPTLSQMAYGDITLRQYSDLDILMKKDNIPKVYSLLENDYKKGKKLTAQEEKIWFKYKHDLGLFNSNNIYLELHWSIFDHDNPVNLQNLDFFKDKKSTSINNFSIPIIYNELFLVYICVHGSRHLFERIEWVSDIDKFIRTQEIDWDLFSKLLVNSNYNKFVYLGLSLSSSIFSTPINKKYIMGYKDIISVQTYLINGWNNNKVISNIKNLYYMTKLYSTTTDKLKYLHKIYLKPTFNEYRYIDLPKKLHFIYYPLRQYLLIKKYFFNLNLHE